MIKGTLYVILVHIYYWTFRFSSDLIHESVRKRLQYTKTVVQAGQILKLLAVFEDVSGARNGGLSNKRLSLPLVGRSQSNARYAQCLGHKNQVRNYKQWRQNYTNWICYLKYGATCVFEYQTRRNKSSDVAMPTEALVPLDYIMRGCFGELLPSGGGDINYTNYRLVSQIK